MTIHETARAFDIPTFCKRYGIGRSTAYREIKFRRLETLKVGRRTLISADAAERWLAQLPTNLNTFCPTPTGNTNAG